MTPEAVARCNELLVRVRRPLDMAAQFVAAVAVAVLLADYLPLSLRIGYVAVTSAVLLSQLLCHRRFVADRERRRRATVWLGRFVVVYALNGLIFGAILAVLAALPHQPVPRSEEHTSELQSLMRSSYAVFGLT